jgi:Putative Flp pilus-assembly TadE/G-like
MIGIRCIEKIRSLANNTRGTSAVMFGIMFGIVAPVLLLGGGFALDVTNLMAKRQFLQSLADGAALAGVGDRQGWSAGPRFASLVLTPMRISPSACSRQPSSLR